MGRTGVEVQSSYSSIRYPGRLQHGGTYDGPGVLSLTCTADQGQHLNVIVVIIWKFTRTQVSMTLTEHNLHRRTDIELLLHCGICSTATPPTYIRT